MRERTLDVFFGIYAQVVFDGLTAPVLERHAEEVELGLQLSPMVDRNAEREDDGSH